MVKQSGRIGAAFANHMNTMHRDARTSPEEKFRVKKQFNSRVFEKNISLN
jgi:hypothetical protein